VELFLEFLNIIRRDIMEVVKEFRKRVFAYDNINANFNALIPQTMEPKTFNDYRPIAL